VGKVFVKFTVEIDGSLTNIEIVKSLNEVCDNEALRLIEQMPKWIPGELNGEIVSRGMAIPITFDGLTGQVKL